MSNRLWVKLAEQAIKEDEMSGNARALLSQAVTIIKKQEGITDACESCGALPGQPHTPTEPEPDLEQLQEWFDEDSGCEATDGCWVEPDGTCPHGHKSWMLEMGLI